MLWDFTRFAVLAQGLKRFGIRVMRVFGSYAVMPLAAGMISHI